MLRDAIIRLKKIKSNQIKPTYQTGFQNFSSSQINKVEAVL